MAKDMETLYQERLNRYVTAMRNEKPDMIPIRPFVAEFVARYAGMTCQDVAHDYNKAFEAAVKCAKDFDWDAVVPNMVYVWTGLAQAAGTAVLRHSRDRHPPHGRVQLHRAARRPGVHAGGRIRRADRRPDGLSLQHLAAPRFDRGQHDRRGLDLPQQHLLDQEWHGDDAVLLRLRPPDRAAPERVRHGLGHRRHLQGAVRHHRRQAARLRGPDDGHAEAAGQGAQGRRGARSRIWSMWG